MERRLRIQLTASVGGVLLLLMALILGITSTVRKANADATSDRYLELIIDRDGYLPTSVDYYGSEEVADAIFETRFFVAWLDTDGQVTRLNLSSMGNMGSEEANRLARRAYRSAVGDVGDIDEYRYLRRTLDDGTTEIALLDRARANADIRYSTLTMAAVMAAGVAGVTLVFGLVSKQIVAPIVRSRESQQQFVVDAGHDLRTPISIISADADVLAMDLGEDDEWLRDIKHQVGVMSDLTESLIMLSRATATDSRKGGEPVAFSEVVEEQVRGFRSRSLLEGHEIRPQVAAGIVVRGNAQYLSRMVGALVDNALKYSAEGSPIDVSLAVAGRTRRAAELVVSNATEGVDASEVGRWFDRFYQSDKARTHRAGGYGIGLSMVRAVAESHGGRAFATAAPDGTSVAFHVVLPLARGERKNG